MQIDKCGRLWAIDSGMVDLSLPTRRRECQPKLLVFHLPSGQAAGKHIFPESLLQVTINITVYKIEGGYETPKNIRD